MTNQNIDARACRLQTHGGVPSLQEKQSRRLQKEKEGETHGARLQFPEMQPGAFWGIACRFHLAAGRAESRRTHVPRAQPTPSFRTQSVRSAAGTLPSKRFPASQFPLPACFARVSPLAPMSLPPEVQNGMTVLPPKF